MRGHNIMAAKNSFVALSIMKATLPLLLLLLLFPGCFSYIISTSYTITVRYNTA